MQTRLAIATLLALGLSAGSAQAQLARTFVSSVSGNDANNCDRLTPCRTFQHAHDGTLAKGEITVLDAGGYGALTINKAISIVSDGVGEAGVLVSGGANGITINAANTDAVSLRGLTVKGIGFGGGNGIVFNTGKSLTIENCVVRGLDGAGVGNGILFIPTVSSTLAVSNTLVTDNANIGIFVVPFGSNLIVKAVLNRVTVYNNGASGVSVNGDFSTGTLDAMVADSVAGRNSNIGFFVSSQAAKSVASMMLVRSVAAANIVGLGVLSATATLRVAQSVVTGNGTGLAAAGSGILRSYGDNQIDGNVDGETAPTTIGKK